MVNFTKAPTKKQALVYVIFNSLHIAEKKITPLVYEMNKYTYYASTDFDWFSDDEVIDMWEKYIDNDNKLDNILWPISLNVWFLLRIIWPDRMRDIFIKKQFDNILLLTNHLC